MINCTAGTVQPPACPGTPGPAVPTPLPPQTQTELPLQRPGSSGLRRTPGLLFTIELLFRIPKRRERMNEITNRISNNYSQW